MILLRCFCEFAPSCHGAALLAAIFFPFGCHLPRSAVLGLFRLGEVRQGVSAQPVGKRCPGPLRELNPSDLS
ncbi:hypothetical protein BJ875DRAFT_13740 [Amylocarpus encephaloides]|uniref:Uncharacterized protein n=1 Tax=Amylocarpus encephaloides TaxID=45428 RepID=A0A9P7YS44_9HELO|nr:hypothetical protein BJ875DRAFT_13740 [Amylocarpus encephaloides]